MIVLFGIEDTENVKMRQNSDYISLNSDRVGFCKDP